jgi:cytochrome c-type biogenesis protein CcmH/NrfF
MLAHAGHWLTSLLYFVPVLAVVLAIWLQSRRDRRNGAESEDSEPSLEDIMEGKHRK